MAGAKDKQVTKYGVPSSSMDLTDLLEKEKECTCNMIKTCGNCKSRPDRENNNRGLKKKICSNKTQKDAGLAVVNANLAVMEQAHQFGMNLKSLETSVITNGKNKVGNTSKNKVGGKYEHLSGGSIEYENSNAHDEDDDYGFTIQQKIEFHPK